MRGWLAKNRKGRLAFGQWLRLTLQPLLVMTLLLLPLLLIIGPRFIVLSRWLIPLIAFVLLTPIATRGWRYARLPIQSEILYTDETVPRWQFWKPFQMQTTHSQPIRFQQRLTSRLTTRPDTPYIVYYLQYKDDYILISLAPQRHPESDQWQPSR